MSEPLFDIADLTCKQALQVAPNVRELAVGQVVEGRYGPARILQIEVGTWQHSTREKHRLTFLDLSSGEEYASSYFPDAPIAHNQAVFFGFPITHSRFRRCAS